MDFIRTTVVLYVLLISTTTTSKAFDPCDSQTDGSDLSVIPFFGKCSPFDPLKPVPWANTVMNMAGNDPQRLMYLAQKVTSVPIASGQTVLNIGNYVVRAKMGTPGQLMFMVLDISNDAVWLPCSGCLGCSGTTSFKPNVSSTYRSLGCATPQCTQFVPGVSCLSGGSVTCTYNQSYGGDSSFSSTLVLDSLRLATDVIQNFAFGCINSVSGGSVPPQGLLGLGRGPTSLISQSGSLYSGIFSYCLPSLKSYYFTGSLRLGPSGQPVNIRTTPLLHNPHRPSLYYVNLTGVSIGRVNVPIAPELFSFNPSTGAGTVIDSGTVITRFLPLAYVAIRDELRKQMGVGVPFSTLGAFDTCFADTGEVVPPVITFRFEGLDMRLPLENSLIHSSSGNLACLSMAAMPNNVNSVMNVIANLQQQNHRIVFDVANSRVGIARELCN
ncbi:hypothetical protein ACFE04_016189 [Oxalis oulophora]